ncbi:probable serine/threonine-protein kinase At1g09600 [Humulus lupulus]|uniref:probable serine/threonine-protein kinase At1g09600 n=1 Tax=Humulus lupulus TaxID=3486 RepID=UPI002B400FD5|nr:probable serine/threonine-protein kinase At1g09600 [Humulus lupulus]XP_062100766.1 probable serine/threonine-protein kinase At1g09600 [Humulus lupulus]
MGCICSKGASEKDVAEEYEKGNELAKATSVQLVAPPSQKRENFLVEVNGDGSVRPLSRATSRANASQTSGSIHRKPKEDDNRVVVVEGPSIDHHQRLATMELSSSKSKPQMTRIVSVVNGNSNGSGGRDPNEEAGWPSWLTSVAGDAIKGWAPRKAESFAKLDKIGQGTYSSVYKARDLETGKIVALKKVRFVNMDPESVRFMAREIHILRRLDHPNVMKLEGLVTSRMSRSLYLVFEYMDHDLAGIAATPGIKFTESQIKCYMQQLLRGLEHCHSRGVLHRDIKGSNILIDNNGVLKIGDFGLATFYDQNQPMTSRVVTLWYRPPELLLGSTEYGPAIDLWSVGCILAEMYAGKPIMPGRTEVEQMHKIFKLCGSPSEDFWQKTRLPHATSFKPQQPYKRRLPETFKDFPSFAMALVDKLLAIEPKDRGSAATALASDFFTTEPLPCDPSSLPKYPPSKEIDAKLRNEEARRRRADTVKGRGPESVRRGSRDANQLPTPEFEDDEDTSMQKHSNAKTSSHKYSSPPEDGGSGFRMEPPRGERQNGYAHSSSMVHPSAAVGSSRSKTVDNSTRNKLRAQRFQKYLAPAESSMISSAKRNETMHAKESEMKKSRIHYSGPLVPPGGNLEDVLKEHERQIQQAVRKARLDKARTNKGYDNYS